MVKALQVLGGQADANKLKMFLVGTELVPAKEWTAFWRKARPACEKDPRIDHSRAFQQVYAMAPQGAAANDPVAHPLPPLEVRKPLKTNLNTFASSSRSTRTWRMRSRAASGSYMQRGVNDETAEFGDRARAGLYMERWYPERRAEWHKALYGLWQDGLAISDVPTEEEQLQLLAASGAAGVEAEAILSALDSRFAAVRDAAEKTRAQLDDAGRLQLRRACSTGRSPTPPRSCDSRRGCSKRASHRRTAGGSSRRRCSSSKSVPSPRLARRCCAGSAEGGEFQTLLAKVPPTEEMRLKLARPAPPVAFVRPLPVSRARGRGARRHAGGTPVGAGAP